MKFRISLSLCACTYFGPGPSTLFFWLFCHFFCVLNYFFFRTPTFGWCKKPKKVFWVTLFFFLRVKLLLQPKVGDGWLRKKKSLNQKNFWMHVYFLRCNFFCPQFFFFMPSIHFNGIVLTITN